MMLVCQRFGNAFSIRSNGLRFNVYTYFGRFFCAIFNTFCATRRGGTLRASTPFTTRLKRSALQLYSFVFSQKDSNARVDTPSNSVSTAPGRKTITEIPKSCNSIRREYAYLSSALFATAYSPVNGNGSSGASSLVVTMILLPFVKSGRKILFTRYTPNTFTLNTRTNSSSVISTNELSVYIPA